MVLFYYQVSELSFICFSDKFMQIISEKRGLIKSLIERPFANYYLISTEEEINVAEASSFALDFKKVEDSQHLLEKFAFSVRTGHPLEHLVWQPNKFYKVHLRSEDGETFDKLKWICLGPAVKCFCRLEEGRECFLVRFTEETVAPNFPHFTRHVQVENQAELDQLLLKNQQVVFKL
jgi:hypothetical protein